MLGVMFMGIIKYIILQRSKYYKEVRKEGSDKKM